jgi:hypothetical protein
VIIIGLATTLVLSLLLVFAQNTGLPLLKSTGLGLLGFGEEITHVNKTTGITYVGPEGFFNNVYGYVGDDFPGVGLVVKGLYWVFCITCLGVICLALVSLLFKQKLMRMTLIFVFIEVFIGFGLVVIAFLCIIVPTVTFDFYYVYTTQYHFLLIPLILTLVMAILAMRGLRKPKSQNMAPAFATGGSNAVHQYAPAPAIAYSPPVQATPTSAARSTWSVRDSGGSRYYSLKAESLYAAAEILKSLNNILPQTYYLVDTDDGTLGRDMNGFFTESPVKTKSLKVPNASGSTGMVVPQSLTIFGEMQKNQSSVAHIRISGQYAKLVLLMKCGQCGYESPVETDAGDLERQCYNCGTTNKTTRAAITVHTPYGAVEI